MKKILMLAAVIASAIVVSEAFGQGPAGSLANRMRANRQAPARQMQGPAAGGAQTGGAKTTAGATSATDSIKMVNAELDMVFITYGNLINKTVLKDPGLPTGLKINLLPKEGQELTDEEKIFAVETVLEMNGVHIEPYGDTDKFVRAIPRAKIRNEGIPLILDPDKLNDIHESARMVSYMVYLKNISCEEAQKALDGLRTKDAPPLAVFERTSSILVTDTGMNIKRMLELLDKIDIKAKPSGYKPFYRMPKYASCSLIRQVLEEVVTFSKQVQLQESGGKQTPNRQTQPQQPTVRPGIFNRGGNNNNNNNNNANIQALVNSISEGERGMIKGEVKVISDEQYSNMLIIYTLPCNMTIFDEIIEKLDIETTPETVVKVYRLKYAEADKVSDMINDLIGNAPSSKNNKGNQNQNARNSSGGSARAAAPQTAAKKSANQRTGEAKAGELSKENTTVLADERINGIVVMTSRSLVSTVESIIEAMDVKLSQVLIETCIVEVGLGHDIKTGLDWVRGMQRSADGKRYQQAIGGGGGSANPIGGASNAVSRILIDGAITTLPSIFNPGAAGLNYALFSEKFDIGAVISMSQSDNTTKYIASPVVMTVDNKEATIEATAARKFLSNYQTSSSYYGSRPAPQYENKDIGIKIKVTPKINPNGTVMLEVEEEYSQVGAKQSILDPDSNSVDIDTALTRKMSADVLLENQQTVVLGGLTDTLTETSETGIPILKDIPWIGKYLFGKTENSESRSELLVFLTPYVLADGNEAEAEALRRKQALSDPNSWQDHGWSKSKLADPVEAKELLRRQKLQWKKIDEEHAAQLELDKAKKSRVLELQERELKDAKDTKDFDLKLKEKSEDLDKAKSEAVANGEVAVNVKEQPEEKPIAEEQPVKVELKVEEEPKVKEETKTQEEAKAEPARNLLQELEEEVKSK